MAYIGDIVVIFGVLFILFGVIGIFKFPNFYTRILIGAKIDTVGVITIFTGIILKHGFSFFSLKVLLLVIIIIIINPLASHMIARSAYLSGYQTESKNNSGKEKYSEEHL